VAVPVRAELDVAGPQQVDGSASQRSISTIRVTCPEHWWRYDLRTGGRVGAPRVRLRRYPVRRVGDGVLVQVPAPATWDAIHRLHAAGHRQAVLTNDASRWLGPRWWQTWRFGTWFDALVDVDEVGVRKPAPAPYLCAAKALEADPGSCLFIDDMPVNCRGAEAVGMASLWFDVRDPDGSVHRLLDRLGL